MYISAMSNGHLRAKLHLETEKKGKRFRKLCINIKITLQRKFLIN